MGVVGAMGGADVESCAGEGGRVSVIRAEASSCLSGGEYGSIQAPYAIEYAWLIADDALSARVHEGGVSSLASCDISGDDTGKQRGSNSVKLKAIPLSKRQFRQNKGKRQREVRASEVLWSSVQVGPKATCFI
jgi:hypothetical protein